ncbi:MAG: STAS domain-containing protein [Solirubrobacterales bacterium]
MVVFGLSEKDIWPGCREIEIEGELDLAVRECLRTALARALAERHHVLVDLSGCDFIDASALAVLVQAHQNLREQGRQLLLYGVRGQVRRLFAITGIAETGLSVTAAAPTAPPISVGDRLGQDVKAPPAAAAVEQDRINPVPSW